MGGSIAPARTGVSIDWTAADDEGPSVPVARTPAEDEEAEDNFEEVVRETGLPMVTALTLDRGSGLLVGMRPTEDGLIPRIGGFVSLRDSRIRLDVSLLRDSTTEHAAVGLTAGDTRVRGSVDTSHDGPPTLRLSQSTRIGPVSIATSVGGTFDALTLGPRVSLRLGAFSVVSGFDMPLASPETARHSLSLGFAPIPALSLNVTASASPTDAAFNLSGVATLGPEAALSFGGGYDGATRTPTATVGATIDDVTLRVDASFGETPTASASVVLREHGVEDQPGERGDERE